VSVSQVRRRRPGPEVKAEPAPAKPDAKSDTTAASESTDKAKATRPLALLDFFPVQDAARTRLSRFFDRLREGRLSTTRCPKDGTLLWPPRVACPRCHTEALEWVDLPSEGRLYAFSAVLAGAPMGMEEDVPYAVGLVDLDGDSLRLFGRIVGRRWEELRVGQRVRVEPMDLADGRVFYRFRVVETGVA
jgi:uncharacterized OB-fold protein